MNIEKYLLKEAKKAYKKDEVPVGCVITKNNKIISKAHNTKQKSNCCINHAEIIAITKAEKKLKDWRLDDCKLYVTLEPCKMCKEVIKQARIKEVYYILNSNFTNEDSKNIEYFSIFENEIQKEYEQLLKSFFKLKR